MNPPEKLSNSQIDRVIEEVADLKIKNSPDAEVGKAIEQKLTNAAARKLAVDRINNRLVTEKNSLGERRQLRLQIAKSAIEKVDDVPRQLADGTIAFTDGATDVVSSAVEKGNQTLINAADISERIRRDTKEKGWMHLGKAAVPLFGIYGLFRMHKAMSPDGEKKGFMAGVQRLISGGIVLALGVMGTNYFSRKYLNKENQSVRSIDVAAAKAAETSKAA